MERFGRNTLSLTGTNMTKNSNSRVISFDYTYGMENILAHHPEQQSKCNRI